MSGRPAMGCQRSEWDARAAPGAVATKRAATAPKDTTAADCRIALGCASAACGSDVGRRLLGMGEDHAASHRLQDARYRDFDGGLHVCLAVLDDDHRAIIQVADALAWLLALLHDLDSHVFAGQQNRL